MTIQFWNSAPAPPALFKGQPLPYSGATYLSRFTSAWIAPMMKVAWSRQIEVDDLWDLTPDLQCKTVGAELEECFMRRMPPSQRPLPYRPSQTDYISKHTPEQGASQEESVDYVKAFGKREAKKIEKGELVVEDGKLYDRSLLKAMYLCWWKDYWYACYLRTVEILLRMTAPLVTRALITQLTRSYTWHNAIRAGASTDNLVPPKSVGFMIGMAIVLWFMLFMSTFFLYHVWIVTRVHGMKLRSALIAMISRKSMRLSGKSRVEMTNGRLTTMVSVDCSFIEKSTDVVLDIPQMPISLAVGIGLLIYTLGYSALVGLGVLLLTGPLKAWMYKRISALRLDQNKIVDTRVRLLSEILNNIRAVKLYAYETLWSKKIGDMRALELEKLRHNNISKSGLNTAMSFIPTLAAILTFITYGLSGHRLDAAIIFSSLQFFNVLRLPIGSMPGVLTGVAEALVATKRIKAMLVAEELHDDINIDEASPFGIDIEADFQFESVASHDNNDTSKDDEKKPSKTSSDSPSEPKEEQVEREPFALQGVNLHIPRGALVCVVGRLGTGKTALLSGMINEMKRTRGHVVFGGSVSYVPQHAWVQSGSIRDNITFSSDPEHVDLSRVEEIIDACALRSDVNMWPDGDLTKIGERGITLSGGQRQRICIARAAYQRSQVVLLDDPLSALDAHVGHHLLEQCILRGPMADRTRVLVTHHLDVLPKADIVLVMDQDGEGVGRIIQQGSYEDLIRQEGEFRTLIEQYGSVSKASESTSDEDELAPPDKKTTQAGAPDGPKADAGKLIIDEERAEGSVSWGVYSGYARSIGHWVYPAVAGLFLVMTQVATVFNTLFLGYWSEDQFSGLSQGGYIGIYGGIGAAMALLTWSAIYTTFLAGIKASYTMFNEAFHGVMRSPTSWHDRTPTGRIINRMSKDIDNLDNRLPDVWYNVISGVLGILGSIALVLYTYPYVALMFIPVLFFDYVATQYYRKTARDLVRIVSLQRSHLYSTFGEQLAGLPIIRAFHRQENFERRLERAIDSEFVAVLSGNLSQGKWLSIRLGFSSYLLVLAVAIFGVLFRNSVSPAKFGVVLTYIIAATSILTGLIGWATEAEQQMNTVERVQYYASLPTEASPTLPEDPSPDEKWPTDGAVSFKDVQMRYRPDLPLVLKGVNFDIRPGEKVGVIGRTGAGKSSIAQVLFRTVEICGGTIEIDGKDTRSLGMDTLRQRIAIIPQDTFLFGGSIRENIDPVGTRSDHELNDALSLIHSDPNASSALREKLHLDGTVANEGSNFSAGEQQLLALVRALVKGCKFLLLDEATSSVDPETDALIQRIIQTEFSDVTLISIAHRLQTVAYYDRILVMDAGSVAEFDTPIALFDNPSSIFRGLCDTKHLSREDLLKIRQDASSMKHSTPVSGYTPHSDGRSSF
ncbi:hypothetical protein IAT38_005479 [Cryptococcus sp. DSM 104549]